MSGGSYLPFIKRNFVEGSSQTPLHPPPPRRSGRRPSAPHAAFSQPLYRRETKAHELATKKVCPGYNSCSPCILCRLSYVSPPRCRLHIAPCRYLRVAQEVPALLHTAASSTNGISVFPGRDNIRTAGVKCTLAVRTTTNRAGCVAFVTLFVHSHVVKGCPLAAADKPNNPTSRLDYTKTQTASSLFRRDNVPSWTYPPLASTVYIEF